MKRLSSRSSIATYKRKTNKSVAPQGHMHASGGRGHLQTTNSTLQNSSSGMAILHVVHPTLAITVTRPSTPYTMVSPIVCTGTGTGTIRQPSENIHIKSNMKQGSAFDFTM